MSEMIERVAKAILKRRFYDCEPDMYGNDIDLFFKQVDPDHVMDAHDEARAAIEAMRAEELEDALRSINQWVNAYPLSVFPEPDLKKARALLAAGGITLDAVSASNMRHVLNGIAGLIPAAIRSGN